MPIIGHYLCLCIYFYPGSPVCLNANSVFSVKSCSGVIREIVFLLALGPQSIDGAGVPGHYGGVQQDLRGRGVSSSLRHCDSPA